MDEEDNIKCGCGERLHKFPLKDKKTDVIRNNGWHLFFLLQIAHKNKTWYYE